MPWTAIATSAGQRRVLVDRDQDRAGGRACGTPWPPSRGRARPTAPIRRARRRRTRGSPATSRTQRSGHAGGSRRCESDVATVDRSDRLDAAVVADDQAAVAAQDAAAPRAGQDRGLGERLGLSAAVGALAVAPSDAGPGGPAGRRVEQVVRGAAAASHQSRRVDARGGDRVVARARARPSSSPVSGFGTSDLVRAATRRSPPRSAAHGPCGASSAAARSAARPLALPPRSSRTPGGRAIVPARVVDVDAPPGGRRVGRRRARRGRGRAAPRAGRRAGGRRASGRSRRARPRRAASGRPARRWRSAPASAARTASRSGGDAGTVSRGSAFSRSARCRGRSASGAPRGPRSARGPACERRARVRRAAGRWCPSRGRLSSVSVVMRTGW